jgi:hypothetical protein
MKLSILYEGFEGQVFSGNDGIRYSIEKIYKILENRKPTQIPVKKLAHNLEEAEADEKIGSESFKQRAQNAKMLPILVQHDNGELWVMDGLHRLWNAIQSKVEYIQGYILDVSNMPEEAIVG